jgi:hypothetical protein
MSSAKISLVRIASSSHPRHARRRSVTSAQTTAVIRMRESGKTSWGIAPPIHDDGI